MNSKNIFFVESEISLVLLLLMVIFALTNIAAYFLQTIGFPLMLYKIADTQLKKWPKVILIINAMAPIIILPLFIIFLFSNDMINDKAEIVETYILNTVSIVTTFVTFVSLIFQIHAFKKILCNTKHRDTGILFFILLTFLFQIITSIFSGNGLLGKITLGNDIYNITIFTNFFAIYLVLLIFNIIKLTKEFEGQNRELSSRTVMEFGLSKRESEIAGLLLKGQSSREIGERLFITKKTVDTHIYNIYKKCGVKSKIGFFNLAE